MAFDEVVGNGNNWKSNSEQDKWTGKGDGPGLSHTRQIQIKQVVESTI